METSSIKRLILLTLLMGCALRTGPAPQPLSPADCRTSPQVTGRWMASGASQLGPAHTKYVFGCDCIFEANSHLLWARLGGRFRYSVDGETIVLEQQQRRELHFARDGDTLQIIWPGGDRETWKLVQATNCAKLSAPITPK